MQPCPRKSDLTPVLIPPTRSVASSSYRYVNRERVSASCVQARLECFRAKREGARSQTVQQKYVWVGSNVAIALFSCERFLKNLEHELFQGVQALDFDIVLPIPAVRSSVLPCREAWLCDL